MYVTSMRGEAGTHETLLCELRKLNVEAEVIAAKTVELSLRSLDLECNIER